MIGGIDQKILTFIRILHYGFYMMTKYRAYWFLISAWLIICPQMLFAGKHDIYVIQISDAITPGVADFVKQGLEQASSEQAACVIIELNTPGGLVDSMRDIVMSMYASTVPVIVYVAPSGARAASAGVMITMAADIAAMAPVTNIGAAHPVNIDGKDGNKTMSEKITNDMAAYIRSIAQKRKRNEKWAEKAVRQSISATETEALKEKVIDLIAKDTDELIQKINGREIAGKGVLKLDQAKIIHLSQNLRTKILKTISDPNIAYILMMIGLAGLYFELSHPGAIFPGVLGGISLILAFFAFRALSVNYAGVLLIILALVFFILEMKIASFGLLSLAGIVSLLLGSLMLFEGKGPELQLAWSVFLPTLISVSAFFVIIANLVFRAQISTPKSGAEALIGEIGIAKTAIMPEGRVQVHGELWKAMSDKPIDAGTKVRVVKVEGLTIDVEPFA